MLLPRVRRHRSIINGPLGPSDLCAARDRKVISYYPDVYHKGLKQIKI